MSILSVFRKKKKKQGGVIITIDPSQTTTTPTSKETAYIDSSGKMVVVGMSKATPNAGTPPTNTVPKEPEVITTLRRGGSRSGGTTPFTPQPNQSVPETPLVYNQPARPQPKPTPKKTPTPEEKWAAYDPNLKAVVTSDKKVYPNLNRRGNYSGWIPEGYKQGELQDVTTLYYIKEVDPNTGQVKGSFGNTIKERYLYGGSNSLPSGSDNKTESLNNNLPFLNNGLDRNVSGYSSVSNNDISSISSGKVGVAKITQGLADWGTKKVNLFKSDFESATGLNKIGTGTAYFFGRYVNTLALQTPQNLYGIYKDPIGFGKGVWSVVSNPIQTSKGILGSAKKDPIGFSADVAAIVTPIPIGKATKFTKNKIVKLGATEVKTSEVFGEVTSKSKADIIKKFEVTKKNGMYEGVHTTSKKFTSFGKTGKRIEDEVVFIADWGSANPSWLGVSKQNYKWSFNPFKNIGQNPAVIKIPFSKLSELPKKVVSQARVIRARAGRTAAYKYVNKWYSKNAKPSTAYIPLRTEFWETPETQVGIPFKYDVKLKREGNILQRAKGYQEYVKIEGYNIPIKRFQTAESKSRKGIKISEINQKYKNYYEYGNAKYITPSTIGYKYSRLSYKSRKSYGYKYRKSSYSGYGISTSSKYNYPTKYTFTGSSYSSYPSSPKYGYKYNSPSSSGSYSYGFYSNNQVNNKQRKKIPFGANKPKLSELRRKKKDIFKTKYTPSFTASVFKIGGKTPKKLIGDGYSPFIRPL